MRSIGTIPVSVQTGVPALKQLCIPMRAGAAATLMPTWFVMIGTGTGVVIRRATTTLFGCLRLVTDQIDNQFDQSLASRLCFLPDTFEMTYVYRLFISVV